MHVVRKEMLVVSRRSVWLLFVQTGIAPLPITKFAYMPFHPLLVVYSVAYLLFLPPCIKSIWIYSRWQKRVEDHRLRCLWRCKGLLYVSIPEAGQCDASVVYSVKAVLEKKGFDHYFFTFIPSRDLRNLKLQKIASESFRDVTVTNDLWVLCVNACVWNAFCSDRNHHHTARFCVPLQSKNRYDTFKSLLNYTDPVICKVVSFDRDFNNNQIRTIEKNAFLRIDVRNL